MTATPDSTGGMVRVEPLGTDIEVRPGESLMAAAQRESYKWPTVCGGLGTCRTCFAEVQAGHDNLTPVENLEAEGLAELGAATAGTVRLACQLGVNGAVQVRERAVRRRTGVTGAAR